jgi:hypothetical protein
VREVGDYDPARIEKVLHWPLCDLFLAYVHRMKVEARRQYETEVLVWATLAPHQKNPPKPPDLPQLLRDPLRGVVLTDG